MFCSKCEEPAVQDSKFCAKCGVSLFPSASPTMQSNLKSISEIVPAPSQVRPWVRYWARMFDVYSFSLIGGVILAVIAPKFVERLNEYALGMMLIFAWVFVEAILVSSFHTTPGKWLLKTRIALTSGSKIAFSQALTRSFKVWWRGFGIGFPIATMITMIVAHGRLSRDGITSWDKDDGFLISHEKIGVLRVLSAVAFFFVFLLVISIGKSVNA